MTWENGLRVEVFPVYLLLPTRGSTIVNNGSLLKIENCRPIWEDVCPYKHVSDERCEQVTWENGLRVSPSTVYCLPATAYSGVDSRE